MSRRDFIESNGATCRNWQWSWSFINEARRVIIFGAWDTHTSDNRSLILDEAWERSHAGRRQPGYTQALEHIRLVEAGAYTLQTFPLTYSGERRDSSGHGPATIGDLSSDLRQRTLIKVGRKWYAEGCPFSFRTSSVNDTP